VARIAKRAEVNKQLIFYYFGSKTGLHEAVTAQAAERIGDQYPSQQSGGPAINRIRKSIRRVFDSLESRPELVTTLFDRGGAAGAPPEVLDRLAEGVRSIASEGQGLGYFRDDADPQLVAQQAVVLCAGYLGLEALGADRRERARWVEGVSELLLRYLAW
jgi:AcrR family transcriptional regulator